MTELSRADTGGLSPSEVGDVRRLLDAAFDGRFDDHDWEHALGGVHVIARESGEVVAHGSVVARTLWIGGDAHEVGYVEAVATAPGAQGRGHGTSVVRAIGEEIRVRFGVGVLSTGEWHFYERLGWCRWQGATYVRRADGEIDRTPDEDDGVMVLAAPGAIDLGATIACAERAGDDW